MNISQMYFLYDKEREKKGKDFFFFTFNALLQMSDMDIYLI